jgi:hypothetical protein
VDHDDLVCDSGAPASSSKHIPTVMEHARAHRRPTSSVGHGAATSPGGVALRRAELESFGGEEARGIQRAAAIEEEDDCYNPVSHVGSTLANGTEPSSPETTRGGGGH